MTTTKLATRALLVRSLAAAALGVGVLYSIAAVDRWTGDWTALLWVCATLFFPWLGGVAAARKISIGAGKLIGASIGAVLVLGPLAAFARPDGPTSSDLAVIATVFTVIGAVNGAMAFPVGIRVRAARSAYDA